MTPRSEFTGFSVVAFLAGLIAALSSPAQADERWRRVCTGQGHLAYAGCVLHNGKRIAFCMPRDRTAQKKLAKGRVALIFRMASKGGKVEMAYPEGGAGAFLVRTQRFVRGERFVISFRRESHTHVYERGMFGGQDATPDNTFHGIKIFRGKRLVQKLACAAAR